MAVQVRQFVEVTLQTLSRDLLYLRGLHYEIRVACPYCQVDECSGHNQMGCTYEDCLHLLELKRGEPLICKKKPSEKILTVRGQEKWFSQITSEVGNNKVQSLSMLLVRATCIQTETRTLKYCPIKWLVVYLYLNPF